MIGEISINNKSLDSIIFCNSCGIQIFASREGIKNWDRLKYMGSPVEKTEDGVTIDLCPECANEFWNSLYSFTNEEAQDAAPPISE